MTVATRLTEYENYETHGGYQTALTQKVFVMNFITSYLPVFLTAFIYVPFANIIVPYLDIFSLTVKPFAESDKQMKTPKGGEFTINPSRLTNQIFYFTVTAQVVNLGMELIVPYLKRRGTAKYKEIQSSRAEKNGGKRSPSPESTDPPEDAAFLKRVREEAQLDVYDPTTDLREMVLQFGYLSLFSVVWPLTAVSFVLNDWLELRADALKICVEMQRPTPWRADTIGPWLDSLTFLTWLGSLTTSALVYMFSDGGLGPDGQPGNIKGWALLLTILLSEHIFLLFRYGVRIVISKLDSPGLQKEHRERFLVRQQHFEENLKDLKKLPRVGTMGPGVEAGRGIEGITKESLEEDARAASLRDSSPETRFWARQKGWRETVHVGKAFIEGDVPEGMSEEKKEL